MNATTRTLIHFFARYKYFAIFPIAVAEGPIISIITGFLASRHVLSFLGGFIAVFLGDLISDSVFYGFGRGGKKYIHRLQWMHITPERIAAVEDHYERAPWKTMIVAKVSYGLGAVFMVAAGVSKMSFKRFLYFAGFLNALRSLALVAIGYYFGRLAVEAGPQYIAEYTAGVFIVVPVACIIWYIWKKHRQKKDPSL